MRGCFFIGHPTGGFIQINVEQALSQLSYERPIFNSEADFQFALAWKLKELCPSAEVRLEYCPADINSSMHIDILVRTPEEWLPIELKYKTRLTDKVINGSERYMLKNHSATDTGCYDFLKDIARLEFLTNNLTKCYRGYAIFITNDLSYLAGTSNSEINHYNFLLTDGASKSGVMNWGLKASEGTRKGRSSPITLTGNYEMRWQDYSSIDDSKTGSFKALVIGVNS